MNPFFLLFSFLLFSNLLFLSFFSLRFLIRTLAKRTQKKNAVRVFAGKSLVLVLFPFPLLNTQSTPKEQSLEWKQSASIILTEKYRFLIKLREGLYSGMGRENVIIRRIGMFAEHFVPVESGELNQNQDNKDYKSNNIRCTV